MQSADVGLGGFLEEEEYEESRGRSDDCMADLGVAVPHGYVMDLLVYMDGAILEG